MPAARSKQAGIIDHGPRHAGRWMLACVCLTAVAVYWRQTRQSFDPTLPARPAELEPTLRDAIERRVALVREDPGDADAHGELAIVYEAYSLWAEARESYDHAHELDSREPTWLHHRALAEINLGQLDLGRRSLDELTAKNPSYAPGLHRLGVLLLEGGDDAGAERMFRSTMLAAPAAPEGYAGLADALLRRGDYDGATTYAKRALELDGTYKLPHFVLGRALLHAGDEQAAQRELALGIDAQPRSLTDPLVPRIERAASSTVDRQLESATKLIDARDLAGAADILRTAAAAHPGDARVLVNLGAVLMDQGQLPQALTTLQRAVELAPREFGAHLNVAACLLRLNRAAEALTAVDRAIDLSPQLARAHFLRSRILEAQGQNGLALVAAQRAVALDPANPGYVQFRGELEQSLGRTQEARASCEQVTRLSPGRWEPWANLFHMDLKLGDIDGARAALHKAQALAPREPIVQGLAAELAQLGAQR